jgi:two-component system chemotaxis response regulator CheB
MELQKKIDVLVVDDSATVRQTFLKILEGKGVISSVTVAADPIFAMEKMEKGWPDVIILDIEMPRMDGLTFLKKIMAERPTPVIICSSLTQEGTEVSLIALSLGAVEIIAKPKLGVGTFIEEIHENIVQAIVAAAYSNVSRQKKIGSSLTGTHPIHERVKKFHDYGTTDKVIAIGASTGGTVAIEMVLEKMPVTISGIVIVQHMPELFTAAFASRLNSICEIEVKEAEDGDRVLQGRALIARGNYHMRLERSGGHYIVEVKQGPIINHHRPSVDVLFRSVAKNAGINALGVILTGMGSDGASGMLDMKEAGAYTIAQDEASSVVWGMPGEAYKKGGVDLLCPLEKIPEKIINHWG